MEKKKERKRIWVVKAAVVVLVVLALCTAAARTVWNLLLPRVETATVYGGVLQDQAQLEGTVRYGGQQTVRADGDWEITEVLVEEGQAVEEGTPLLRVDTTQLELSVRELELQRETLGHERNRAGTTWSRIEEIDTERVLLEDQIGVLRAQYPADGVLTAPFAGTVQQVQADAGMRAAAGTELLTLQPADSPRIVEWEMSEEALQRFSGMETIQLYFIADTAGERTYQSFREVRSVYWPRVAFSFRESSLKKYMTRSAACAGLGVSAFATIKLPISIVFSVQLTNPICPGKAMSAWV